MKTIKDIITRNKKYADIVNDEGQVTLQGRDMGKNYTSSKLTLGTHWVGGDLQVSIEKYEVVVCAYSKIRKYRRLKGGYRPEKVIRYTYYYQEGDKCVRARDFNSLDKLIKDLKEKTSNQEVLTIPMEV
jgi:hypothetical protein